MKLKALSLPIVDATMINLAVAGCGQSSTSITTNPTAFNAAPATALSPGHAPPFLEPGGVGDNRTLPSMDLNAAAKKLGISENQLRSALGSSQGPMDLAVAAKQLGISEEALQQALGSPGGAPPSIGAQPTRTQ